MDTELNCKPSAPHPPEVKEALSHILRSTPFSGSKQCQALLKFLVQHSLRGHEEELKERIIGIEVFGRKPDYDTSEDAVVRARAGEVRKRLAQYYTSDEGQDSAVRIVITPGSYRPTFVSYPDTNGEGEQGQPGHRAAGNAPDHDTQEHFKPETDAIRVPRAVSRLSKVARQRVWRIAAAVAGAILFAVWTGTANWRKSELDLFWQPIFETKRPALIYVGSLDVYVPISNGRTAGPPGDQELPVIYRTPEPLAEDQVLTARDLTIDQFGFSGTGELEASVDLATLLTAHRLSFSLRRDTNLPFDDLRGSPAILLGAYTNFWNTNITQNLPFFFDRLVRIRERGGQSRVWSLVLKAGVPPPEDYAIVARLPDSETGSPIISLAGMTTCGTAAAGEFVTNPAQMKKLDSIPRDALERKNLELVLHETFVDCAPTSIDVVAWRSW